MSLKQKLIIWQQFVPRILSSNKFFWLIVGFFVFQASWIALTGLYPMAFDEDFHLGIIRLYAQHVSPFWSSQPEDANVFGAVYRDPSYLYHYLLSFPFRLISIFTSDQTVQVLWLRAINIGLFTSGLLLFRKVMLATGVSKALVQSCFLVFVLIPIIPLLAAQINYDNLLFPLMALIFLLTLKASNSLRTSKNFPIIPLLALIITSLLTSIVKYAFLPILFAVFIFLTVRLRQTFSKTKHLWNSAIKSWLIINRFHKGLLITGLVLSIGLFSQRYVVNILLYHTPIPDCSKVLDVEACSDYGPWIRDYNLNQTKSTDSLSPLVFSKAWVYGMWFRLFFTVDGPATQFETRGAMMLPAVASILLLAVGLILTAVYGVKIVRNNKSSAIRLFILTSSIYIGVLWLDQYQAFLHTGKAVAINGRYLLPILLPLLLLFGLVYQSVLKQRPNLKTVLLVISVVCLSWGGGAMTYILRSNDNWYWPNRYVRNLNHFVQAVFRPITPGFYDKGQFWR